MGSDGQLGVDGNLGWYRLAWYHPMAPAMRRQTDDLRIIETRPLIPPAILHEELPVTERASELIFTARRAIADIVHGRDQRVMAVVGPCSIHDVDAARIYAERLKKTADEVADKVLVVMRAYFEKPRTSVGWKGLINDPDLDESFQVNKGLRLARKLLVDVNEMGLPTGSEFLDLQIPQHIADLTSWVAIGARTTESQVHRELASGLSMPVGFKNTTEGNLQQAVDAVKAAQSGHWFPSVTKQAVGALFHTTGNPDCHVILRGGSRSGPNYDEESVNAACRLLTKAKVPARVMIDCSHGNSEKDYRNQGKVLHAVARQLQSGSGAIMGVMIESNLVEGRQDAVIGQPLVFGQSVTDSCVSQDESDRMLKELADAV
ncbi:MAG TPA: 3-deoxy-7-phosphoheptulonate synthase [Fimbriimonas sp.]|nr:3-deoxy-7-phosphoheptulonate synthase [Fimbriimonas sp.]